MTNIVQILLVGIIVMAAALYAAWNLAGAAMRHRWANWALGHAPNDGWTYRLLQRQVLRQRERLLGSGCGSCGSNQDRKQG